MYKYFLEYIDMNNIRKWLIDGPADVHKVAVVCKVQRASDICSDLHRSLDLWVILVFEVASHSEQNSSATKIVAIETQENPKFQLYLLWDGRSDWLSISDTVIVLW